MISQFLTAVFELRPSKRKASVLEYIRNETENLYWQIISDSKTKAVEAASLVGKENKNNRKDIIEQIYKNALILSKNLSEPVAQSLAEDVISSIKSFVELSIDENKKQEPSYPSKEDNTILDWKTNLTNFSETIDQESEYSLRSEILKKTKTPTPRPFSLLRERDCSIIRNSEGKLAVVLNILRASDKRAKEAIIDEGKNATTNEPIKRSKRKTIIIVPLSCSKWHEDKFFYKKSYLKSAKIVKHGDKWFMHASFNFQITEIKTSGAILGVDRGIIYPIAATVVDKNGSVIETLGCKGEELGVAIKNSMNKRKWQQKRRGYSSEKFTNRIDNTLHQLANDVVNMASDNKAEVVLEDLKGLKTTITKKRIKGARKNNWQKILKNAQLGKLEQILNYKLAMKGLPTFRKVLATGTSQTCPSCGQKAKENRLTRDHFQCISCGYEQHADLSASVIVARRGLMKVKKGDNLENLHKNMVISLKKNDDTGLGPLTELIG